MLSNRYLLPVRKAAFSRLARMEPETLDEILMLSLNRLQPSDFRAWVVTRVGELGRNALTKAVIRSWATALPYARCQGRSGLKSLALKQL